MRIFCDTNVITELLEKRLQYEAVSKILNLPADKCELYVSEGGFYTITFLVDKQLRKLSVFNPDRLINERKILLRILDTFQICTANKTGLLQGVIDASFKDLEDSYQFQSALNCGADVLLTINIKDFEGVMNDPRIKIMTPQSFVTETLPALLG